MFFYICVMKDENLEKVRTQMRRGILEMCILSIIAEEEVYPSDIIQKLKNSEMIVVEGTLYPLLTRLKNAGLLEYRWEESTSGPPRKYYSLSPQGKSFQLELKSTWDALQKAVEHITTSK